MQDISFKMRHMYCILRSVNYTVWNNIKMSPYIWPNAESGLPNNNQRWTVLCMRSDRNIIAADIFGVSILIIAWTDFRAMR